MDFSKSTIKHLIIHEIGNKLRDEKVFLSEKLQELDEKLENILLNYFFRSFMSEKELLCFHHNSDIALNEIYTYSKNIFRSNKEDVFINTSQYIAKHLYEYSLHPKISKGELIVAYISNVVYDNNHIDVIGIFKSENKESFLKVIKDKEAIHIEENAGINVSKLEKGCLVLNTCEESGYVVLNIDNYSQQTDYWNNKFLNLQSVSNNTLKTKKIIQLCREFSNDILSSKYDNDVKFTFNNNYINYFEDNMCFDINSFNDSIFQDSAIKDEFFEYQNRSKDTFDFNFDDKFELSRSEIKREKSKIKNIIKLDTKLELKVLLDKNDITRNIEKGFDESKGMYFYKIYFNEEVN